ncbi:MAG: ExeM/NucH family extracellular endonuclease, partial [Acidimicrobiia bacterium]|nr:ExeM/NucH family extracellular endonuclease [Acidimicrobiia bacterium]
AAPAAQAVAPPDSTVFINEIHYDNVGTDTGELIEVANPTGADLSAWSIVLYNGSGGAPYSTRALSGTGELVVLTYPSNGIQNGSPDGIALVNGTTVEQFLSYEGAFAAVGGPANGVTSTDIGVAEAGTEPVGQSLQLTGTGDSYGDFTWTGPVPATAGTANTGQTFQAGGDQVLTVANPGPVTHQAGTAADYTVSATDPDDVVTAATVDADAPAGVTATVTGVGTNTATVTFSVSPDAADGTTTTPVTFSTADGSVTTEFTLTVTTIDECGQVPTHEIADVQGSGATSPLLGQDVIVEGVVTADYQSSGEFGGFFIQDLTPDDDPLTSDGIRVFNNTTPVAIGDVVRVAGMPAEFASADRITGSETQFGSRATITDCLIDATPPAPLPVALPFAETVDGVDGQERYEGVLIELVNDDLVATDLYTLGRFGEIALTTGEPLFNPSSSDRDRADLNADRILLDDGFSGQNLTTLPYTVGGDGMTLPRIGDTVAASETVSGVLTYSFGDFRIVPVIPGTPVDFERTNPRTDAPDPVGGDLQVASFNVLNYFVDFGGFARGADDAAELARQEAKLVAAIVALDADIVGLIEIANDDGDAIDTLVAALNAAQPGTDDDYVAVDPPAMNTPTSLGGTYGTDAIRQAIIYRPAVVVPTGPPPSDPELLNPPDPAFPDEPLFDRPPAVQEFVPVGGGTEITVIVNHFKSKGSSNEQCGMPDPLGGNCDDLRERQSAGLIDLVDRLGADNVLLLGDFNAYEEEAPITILEAAGYDSAAAALADLDRYSYSFDGELGTLDYIFTSPALTPLVTGVDIWHINAPEARALDYNDFNQPQLYAPDPFESSDHDPVLIGLNLVPDVTAPAAPMVTAMAGWHAATFTVTPGDDGGAAVTAYEVTLRDGNTVVETRTVSADGDLSVTFGGLRTGTTYTASVVATNAVGASAAGTVTATPFVPADTSALMIADRACPAGGSITWTIVNTLGIPVSFDWMAQMARSTGTGVVEAGASTEVTTEFRGSGRNAFRVLVDRIVQDRTQSALARFCTPAKAPE